MLPITISKEMFLRDLDYYGIVTQEGSVKSEHDDWPEKVAKEMMPIKAEYHSEAKPKISQIRAILEEKRKDAQCDFCGATCRVVLTGYGHWALQCPTFERFHAFCFVSAP